jgi:hypothetical protein
MRRKNEMVVVVVVIHIVGACQCGWELELGTSTRKVQCCPSIYRSYQCGPVLGCNYKLDIRDRLKCWSPLGTVSCIVHSNTMKHD